MRRQLRGLAPAALAGVLACFASAAGGDGPRFRGPNGAGTAAGADLPVRWTARDGVRWQVKIPGAGHSSPVVSKGRVFLESASSDGKERWLLCLDAADGKTL